MENIFLQNEQQESTYDRDKDIRNGLAMFKLSRECDTPQNILRAVQDKSRVVSEFNCDSIEYSNLLDEMGYDKTVAYLEKREEAKKDVNVFIYILAEWSPGQMFITEEIAKLAIAGDGGEIGIRLMKEFDKGFRFKELGE